MEQVELIPSPAGRRRAALVFDRDSAYWYARGYFDARASGSEQSTHEVEQRWRSAYAEGYECGIADYCRMVHPEDEEPWPSGNDASRP